MSLLLQPLLIVGGAIAIAVLVQSIVRRKVPLEVLQAHHEVAGIMMGLVGGMYGILIAFVVVAMWSDFEEARETVWAEANGLADLGRIGSALPEPHGSQIHQHTLDYFEIYPREEWAQMANGTTSEKGNALYNALWQDVVRFEPRTERERNLQLAALQALDQFSDERRMRVVLSRRTLPTLLWVVLITGGVIVLGFANFFGLRYPRSQSLMTGAVAASVGLALYTVAALEAPFAGAIHIPRAEVEEIVSILRTAR